ncbi:MAG: hypothetical protein KGM95_06660 [Betaproteobacteria bacterium]|nr:hypothetical protein [Betaproteobacteria bacterium]
MERNEHAILKKKVRAARRPGSLSDLKNRSEKVAGREQILTILQTNSCSIGQKSGEIWAGQTLLQPISFKSDRLLWPVNTYFTPATSGG